MRKLILASATLGIIAVGGIANANADSRSDYERQSYNYTQQESAATARGEVWLAPGVTAPAYRTGTMYQNRTYMNEPIYEGRNVYVDEPAYVVQPRPMYRTLGPSYGYQPSYADPWYMPGDAAIINQERANQRSTR